MSQDKNKRLAFLRNNLQGDLFDYDTLYSCGMECEELGDDFFAVCYLTVAWLLLADDKTKRDELSTVIDKIEFKDKTQQEREQIRRYKRQVSAYVLKKLLYPNREVNISDYITEAPPKGRKNKIFLGPAMIANNSTSYAIEMRKQNEYAFSFTQAHMKKFYKVDAIYPEGYFFGEFVADLIAEFDVFHFFYSRTLLDKYIDLPILKKLGKKMIMQFCGDDIRILPKVILKNPGMTYALISYEPFKHFYSHGKDIVKSITEQSKYIDSCLARTEVLHYVKDYFNNVYRWAISVDMEAYGPADAPTKNEKFTIVHAPSNQAIKGTKYILKAVEELKKKYDFDFILVEKMNHQQAKEVYQNCDLLVDQIIGGTYGGLAIETLSMNKAVVCYISRFHRKKYPKELPIISATPMTIKKVLEWALNNQEEVFKISQKGREYVAKYCDVRNQVTSILDIYDKL